MDTACTSTFVGGGKFAVCCHSHGLIWAGRAALIALWLAQRERRGRHPCIWHCKRAWRTLERHQDL